MSITSRCVEIEQETLVLADERFRTTDFVQNLAAAGEVGVPGGSQVRQRVGNRFGRIGFLAGEFEQVDAVGARTVAVRRGCSVFL